MTRNKIKKIIEAIKDTEINEISISSFWGFQKIKMSKTLNNENIVNQEIDNTLNKANNQNIEIPQTVNSGINESSNKIKTENLNQDEDIITDDKLLTIINAPLVGTFYESSKPGEAPFINIGDEISKGMPLCIIEAMKIFNEIESDYDGVVVELLINDGEPVEYGQPLFKIKEK